ncbi:hypothetical protein Z043_124704 [Scleropages formosus]|uniref:Uncharacterized protein n=1 Tax=Scleropages formosus TaxID=113540 RepID=A0A0P7UC38_SCLFO|nr:hypothetical protein Z043_124704 [Scleropages formosus]
MLRRFPGCVEVPGSTGPADQPRPHEEAAPPKSRMSQKLQTIRIATRFYCAIKHVRNRGGTGQCSHPLLHSPSTLIRSALSESSPLQCPTGYLFGLPSLSVPCPYKSPFNFYL